MKFMDALSSLESEFGPDFREVAPPDDIRMQVIDGTVVRKKRTPEEIREEREYLVKYLPDAIKNRNVTMPIIVIETHCTETEIRVTIKKLGLQEKWRKNVERRRMRTLTNQETGEKIDFINTKGAATFLGLSAGTLRQMVTKKGIVGNWRIEKTYPPIPLKTENVDEPSRITLKRINVENYKRRVRIINEKIAQLQDEIDDYEMNKI